MNRKFKIKFVTVAPDLLSTPVYIIASSGHAKVVIDLFEKGGQYSVAGIVDGSRAKGSAYRGYGVLGSRDDLPGLMKREPGASLFVAIGDNWLRKQVVDDIHQKVPRAVFASAIHPTANLGSGVRVEHGAVVMAGAVVQADAVLGAFSIVNTGALVDHDSQLGAFASLGPGAVTGGNVGIGEYTAVGMSATIRHGLHIGAHTVIGAGSLVLEDCPDQRVLYGVPARDMRSREIGESYL